MSEYTKSYQELNIQQKQAVDTLLGPVMVVAGPGSGKTQLLSLRVANILDSQDVMPDNILCLTFTDAAAYNMRKRLASFIGKKAYKVDIHTFHSFGQSILKDYYEYTSGVERIPVDNVYQTEIIDEIITKLPYNHILISKIYDKSKLISNLLSAIKYIKQAGLTPLEYLQILEQNQDFFSEVRSIIKSIDDISLRSSKDRDQKLAQFRELVNSIPVATNHHGYFVSYGESLKKSLLEAISQTEELEKGYKPISQWKVKYLIKAKDGSKVLSDVERLEKQKAIADIYKKYQDYLEKNQLLDFSDMLLDALTLLKQNESLRDKLQSKYQFILVDEFQDTNEAQMQLVLSIMGDNPEPNILVVGDDDQAVYGFQGADVSHMLSFQNKFPTAELIVLTTNYRSRQEILDIARKVITQGQDRLENRIEVLEKKLESAKLRQDGDLAYYEFQSQAEEYTWIAQTIENYRKKQVDLSEIAVIARSHSDLQAIVPFLSQYDLPLDYEKQYNLLNETIINQLVEMLEFIYSLTPSQSPRNDLLPVILSYPFWDIDPITIWRFFQERDYNRSYIERLYSASDLKLQSFAQLFLNLAIISEHETLEVILFKLIGSLDSDINTQSPFHKYYFGKSVFEQSENQYIENLSKIEAFVHNLVSYKKGQRVSLADGLATIRAYQNQGGMLVNLPLNNGKQTVKLMTAHKVKGLEFETVFVIGANKNSWMSKGRAMPYPFPLNLPIVPNQDTEDDFLRILFVALTRSKTNLFITNHLFDSKGKEKHTLPYLDFMEVSNKPQLENLAITTGIIRSLQPNSLHSNELSFLEGVVQKYRLSASHINKFVNVMYGGPLAVLESVLLRFPSISSPATAYGNIVHKIFNYISNSLHATQIFPDMSELMNLATKYLYQEKLSLDDTNKVLSKIQDQLPQLLEIKKDDFFIIHKSEYNLGVLSLEWQDIPLTGSIDRIEDNGDYYTVVDFKTGTPVLSWDDKNKADKLYEYKRQLWFYAFLLKVADQYQDKPLKGRIDFLEPNIEGEYVSLTLDIISSDIDYIANLSQIIYHKILSLDFPDTDLYKQRGQGSIDFIQDLLEHKV
ncbi:MAG: DNA-dependent ATPase and helicase [Candidatus Parcubacteria bacterium]|jgi:DNA helicase-2/ATP-dependent DNA helicase PcrA